LNLAPLLIGSGSFAVATVTCAIPGLRRRVPRRTLAASAIATLAVASGIGGAVSSGSATVLSPINVLLRTVICGLCVLAAAGLGRSDRSIPWWWIVAISLPASLVAFASPVWWLAPAIAGTALSLALARAGGTVLKAAACGGLAQVALRLHWPDVTLAPSAIAAVIIMAILIPGLLRLTGPARRTVLWTAGGVAAGVIVLCVTAAVALDESRSPLTSGLASAKAGLRAAAQGDDSLALADFSQADTSFRRADTDLRWAAPSEIVPVVSQQVRVARVAAAAGRTLSQAGSLTASQVDVGDLRFEAGQFPIERLAPLQQPLEVASSDLSAAVDELEPLSSPWLVTPVASRLTTALTQLEQAQHEASVALMAVQVVPALLGGDGPRKYFIAFQNPAESRALGGVIGDYAEVQADSGRLHLMRVGTVGQLDTFGDPSARKLVAPADYVARYARFDPQIYWENIVMTPDFPTAAGIIANLYPQCGGDPINGVISVDPVGLAAMLRVVGSVSVAGWPVPVSSSNVVEIVGHQEFVAYATNNSGRLEFLQALTKAVWEKLTSAHLPSPPDLVSDLAPAVDGGHIMLYSTSPDGERLFVAMGASGAVPRVSSDFLGVVTQNAAGDKIDWYLRRSINYQVTIDKATGALNATVDIELHNLAPSSGQPPLVIDAGGGVVDKPGDSKLYLSVYTPWSEVTALVDGRRALVESARELGRNVYSIFVTTPPGATTRVELQLSGVLRGPALPYRLVVWHQPVLFPDAVATGVTYESG
jgi:Protein of unknown function (DUF4012)